jgi:hypothetical protein
VVIERAPWDRRDGEPARAYGAFRAYRDAGPARTVSRLELASPRTLERWSTRWDWPARAVAWDDETHRLEDLRRLEAIRTMHDQHQRAGRAAMGKALAALAALEPADISAAAAARLLEIGSRLERDMLTSSVEELQGAPRTSAAGDPWDAIARELRAGTAD